MTGLVNDVKLALKLLWKRPVSSALILGVLSIGVTGNTAIFSIFNGLFLEPLPFAEPGRIVKCRRGRASVGPRARFE